MNKLTIINDSDLNDSQAMLITRTVIDEGRISGNSYCFATKIELNGTDYMVFSHRNKASDTFRITAA